MHVFNKLFKILKKTRSNFSKTLSTLIKKGINEEVLEDFEEQLLETDMGFQTVEEVLDVIRKNKSQNPLNDIKEYLLSVIQKEEEFEEKNKPKIIMIVGVNGTGKTTSAAKLASKYKKSGKNVMLIAADTYRAAAVQQLQIWSNRIDCKLICNEKTSEPSAVLFDGLRSAQANNNDVVIVDTAGRLHNSESLMLELKKMYRLIDTRFSDFNVNTLITLDANLGQNSLVQAKEFNKHCNLDGAILTKLDGTAKGGILFPLYLETNIPVKYIGYGETLEDLERFNALTYIDSLLEISNDEM